MFFTEIKIQNFRNFSNIEFKPSPKINLIYGKNGSGKSSLLEAIGYLCKGKSFRTSHNDSLIHKGTESFIVFGEKSLKSKIGISRSLYNKTPVIQINGNTGYKLSDLATISPAQIISPSDSNILNLGGPKSRRALLDWGTFYFFDSFFQIWRNFSLLLKQRNTYLKKKFTYEYLKYIDSELVQNALRIRDHRETYINNLIPYAQNIIKSFLPEYDISFEIYHGWDKKKNLEEILISNYERDRALCHTQSGPQRADLIIKCNGIPVQELLSRGQQKLLITAFKFAQGIFLETKSIKPCIFMIDDFASELDDAKKDIFTEYLSNIKGQVFITSTSPDLIIKLQTDKSAFFELTDNYIQKGNKIND